jgi:hypothetical protein
VLHRTEVKCSGRQSLSAETRVLQLRSRQIDHQYEDAYDLFVPRGHASHERASRGDTSRVGMCLMGVHLMGVHLINVHLTGVHLIGLYLMVVDLSRSELQMPVFALVAGWSLLRAAAAIHICWDKRYSRLQNRLPPHTRLGTFYPQSRTRAQPHPSH